MNTKNAKNPMEIIEGFGGVFDETYDRFAMQYSFKTEEDGKGDRSRNFIFNRFKVIHFGIMLKIKVEMLQ